LLHCGALKSWWWWYFFVQLRLNFSAVVLAEEFYWAEDFSSLKIFVLKPVLKNCAVHILKKTLYFSAAKITKIENLSRKNYRPPI
jgi:hypothetical protein